MHEWSDFPHRAPGLFRLPGSVRDGGGAGADPAREWSAGGIREGRRRSTASLRRAGDRQERTGQRVKILVAEPLAAAGIELLKAQPGWDIVISNPKEYAQHLSDADA